MQTFGVNDINKKKSRITHDRKTAAALALCHIYINIYFSRLIYDEYFVNYDTDLLRNIEECHWEYFSNLLYASLCSFHF